MKDDGFLSRLMDDEKEEIQQITYSPYESAHIAQFHRSSQSPEKEDEFHPKKRSISQNEAQFPNEVPLKMDEEGYLKDVQIPPPTEYLQKRFLLVNSYKQENITTSISRGCWPISQANSMKMNDYLQNSGGVYLIVGVNETKTFQGVALARIPIDFSSPLVAFTMDPNTSMYYQFKVEWLHMYKIPFDELSQWKNPWNNFKSISDFSGEIEELDPRIGERVMSNFIREGSRNFLPPRPVQVPEMYPRGRMMDPPYYGRMQDSQMIEKEDLHKQIRGPPQDKKTRMMYNPHYLPSAEMENYSMYGAPVPMMDGYMRMHQGRYKIPPRDEYGFRMDPKTMGKGEDRRFGLPPHMYHDYPPYMKGHPRHMDKSFPSRNRRPKKQSSSKTSSPRSSRSQRRKRSHSRSGTKARVGRRNSRNYKRNDSSHRARSRPKRYSPPIKRRPRDRSQEPKSKTSDKKDPQKERMRRNSPFKESDQRPKQTKRTRSISRKSNQRDLIREERRKKISPRKSRSRSREHDRIRHPPNRQTWKGKERTHSPRKRSNDSRKRDIKSKFSEKSKSPKRTNRSNIKHSEEIKQNKPRKKSDIETYSNSLHFSPNPIETENTRWDPDPIVTEQEKVQPDQKPFKQVYEIKFKNKEFTKTKKYVPSSYQKDNPNVIGSRIEERRREREVDRERRERTRERSISNRERERNLQNRPNRDERDRRTLQRKRSRSQRNAFEKRRKIPSLRHKSRERRREKSKEYEYKSKRKEYSKSPKRSQSRDTEKLMNIDEDEWDQHFHDKVAEPEKSSSKTSREPSVQVDYSSSKKESSAIKEIEEKNKDFKEENLVNAEKLKLLVAERIKNEQQMKISLSSKNNDLRRIISPLQNYSLETNANKQFPSPGKPKDLQPIAHDSPTKQPLNIVKHNSSKEESGVSLSIKKLNQSGQQKFESNVSFQIEAKGDKKIINTINLGKKKEEVQPKLENDLRARIEAMKSSSKLQDSKDQKDSKKELEILKE